MLEGEKGREPSIEAFLGEPTRDLDAWAWLWTGDHSFPTGQFPTGNPPGFFGRLKLLCKRLLRPVLKFALADLWDRQRVFNLILLENFARERAYLHQSVESHQRAIEAHAALLEGLDRRVAQSMTDVMGHNDALFARVDQKLDRYRREAKDLWHRLGALIAADEGGSSAAKAGRRAAQQEQEYLELERRYRGSEEDIAQRAATYLPYLEKAPGEVLDLGCGRGEALDVLGRHGIDARGIDSSGAMVALCREKGLRADEGDLLDSLMALEPSTLGAVVSFHVIEHLPTETVERLIRLAWNALRPGGVLVLETPSPLSLVMASRDFWIDPTHRRPVHPASLEVTFREAGFEPVHRLDLHPFAGQDRLPEINLDALADDQKALGDHMNRLRDLLDDLLFGDRDFGMVGIKPAGE